MLRPGGVGGRRVRIRVRSVLQCRILIRAEAAQMPGIVFMRFAPAEVFESPWYCELTKAGFPVKNGVLALPERAGIGYQLPAEFVKACLIR